MNSLEAEVMKYVNVQEGTEQELHFKIDVVFALSDYHALYNKKQRLEHSFEWRAKYLADYLVLNGRYIPK